MKSVLSELYLSFRKTGGPVFSFLGLGVTVFAFYFKPNNSVSLGWVLLVGLFIVQVIVVLNDFAFRAYHAATRVLPTVKRGSKPPSLGANAVALLLLDKSELYAHETVVSVYVMDDEFEKLIGAGFVLNVQDNGLIQVLVTMQVGSEDTTLWDQVRSSDSNVLKKILVKPSIPKQLFRTGA